MDSGEASSQQHAIASHRAFAVAVHESLDQALVRRTRRMFWVDVDFADWPLDDAELLQRLADWLRLPQRQLLLLASDYEALRRRARFTAWHRRWSHAISAYTPVEDDVVQLPSLLLAEDAVLVQLLDKAHWRGWVSTTPALLRLWRERIDALLQRSAPAFPVTTLGL